MDQHIIPSSLSSDGWPLVDSTPLSRTIVPLLSTLQDRLHSERSWRVYQQDIKHFLTWLADRGITSFAAIGVNEMYSYHAHLRQYRYGPGEGKPYSHATINRMFTVARRILEILTEQGAIQANPCAAMHVKKMAVADETTHAALDKQQAGQLLKLIDTKTSKGKRDYAIVSLLLRTGLRRNECVMLNIGDITMMQGHYVAMIAHAKGDRPEYVKIPPDVWRYIDEYMQSFKRQYGGLDAPLFISFRKGDHPSLVKNAAGQIVEARIDVKSIELTVKELGAAIGVPELTPHGLRASFITLAMEEGASLEQTQYAARHSDPRMTERYRKRKFNLDNNAVDKLSFLSREE
jgi:integrase/recombinase XerD